MPKRTSNPKYLEARRQLLASKPPCHWCGQPATEADHVIEHDAGGTDTLDNLVPACKPCNSRRGQLYKAKKDNARMQARNAGINLQTQTQTQTPDAFFVDDALPPTPSYSLSFENQPEPAETNLIDLGDANIGREQPRLETIGVGGKTFGPLVQAWAKRHMSVDLMPWQVHAINGALTCDDAGDPYSLTFREALTTTARQQGKSVALVALIGWWMTDYAQLRGEPQSVLSVANKLDRAEAIFAQLAHVLVEQFGGKQMAAVGRKSVTVGKSEWLIRAATKNLHGGSHDLIVVDELWDIDSAVIDDALRPSQIARRSPLLWMASTAGDESSLTMIQLREQALANIDAGERGLLYFAEWSMPPGVDYRDEQYWRWANPALGTTITLQALRSVSKKDSFLRAHLNLWVSARGAWITPAEWDSHITKEDFPTGVPSILAVDSSVDDARYVGVHAAVIDNQAIVKVAFVVQTENEMWEHIERIMADQKVQLAITPTLEIHLPMNLQRRYQTVGYGELLRFSSLVRSMILEGKVRHNGEKMLAEHVCRAVITKTAQGVVLSSQKSPGPIELCRCMAWAVALVSKPKQATKPMLVITG